MWFPRWFAAGALRCVGYRSVYLSSDGVAHLNYQTYKFTTRLLASHCNLAQVIHLRPAVHYTVCCPFWQATLMHTQPEVDRYYLVKDFKNEKEKNYKIRLYLMD